MNISEIMAIIKYRFFFLMKYTEKPKLLFLKLKKKKCYPRQEEKNKEKMMGAENK